MGTNTATSRVQNRLRSGPWVPLLPALIVLLVYAPARHFGLVWDDRHYLATLPFQDWPGLLHWAFTPFFGLYFRPLPLLTLGAETLLWGGPALSHAVSALLLAAGAALVALLGQELDRRWRGADSASAPFTSLAAGLFYGLHPAMLEAAAWISGRFDLMAALACLALLLADLRLARPALRAAVFAVLFLLGALCKEMVLGLALLLPAWHLLLAPQGGWPALWARRFDYLAIIAAGLIYLALRHALCGDLAGTVDFLDIPLSERLALIGKTLGGFVIATAWPLNAGPVHALRGDVSFADALTLLGGAAVLVAALGVVDRLRGARLPAPLLLAACFVLALAPVSNLVPLAIGGSYYQDRYLALPLCFAALGLGLLASYPLQGRSVSGAARLGAQALWVALALQAACTAALLPSWRDNLSLWSRAAQADPRSVLALSNLQNAQVEGGQYDEARQTGEQLIRLSPRLPAAQWLLHAEALRQLGDAQGALRSLEQASSAPGADQPATRAAILRTAGQTYLDAGQLEPAQAQLQQSLALDGANPETPYYLAIIALARGDAAQGQRYLDAAQRNAGPALAREQRDKLAGFVEMVKGSAATPR